MKALLRADWLRLRRRRDLWIIFAAVFLVGGIGFITGYRTDVEDPPAFNLAEFEQQLDGGFFEGMTQEEINAARPQLIADAQAAQTANVAERDAAQLILLQKYELPQSFLTMIGPGIAPIVALLLIASLVIGDEFRFGTLRTSLLAAGNRRKFLIARLVSLFALTVGMFVVMLALAAILSIALVVVGAELPPATMPVNGGAAIGMIGGEILSVTVVIVLATALTLLLRSGALPLLLVILGYLLELFIASLPIFRLGELFAGVPQFFPSTSIWTLQARLGYDSGGLALAEAQVPPAAIDLALPIVALTVVAWGLIFLVIADRRIRGMDVTE